MIILLSLELVLIVCITGKKTNKKFKSDWLRFLKRLKSNTLVYYFTD